MPLEKRQSQLALFHGGGEELKALTASAGIGVVEALQQRRAGVDGVAACQDGRAGVHSGMAIGLIMTTTVIFITVGFRHSGKLPRLRVE